MLCHLRAIERHTTQVVWPGRISEVMSRNHVHLLMIKGSLSAPLIVDPRISICATILGEVLRRHGEPSPISGLRACFRIRSRGRFDLAEVGLPV
jgi:hypothetical protein